MNQRVQDIDEMIAGMHEALNGRVPNEATQRKLDELLKERAEAERSNWHGWECYCNDCCT